MNHTFKSNLTDKRNLKDPKKNMALANLSINYTRKNIKPEYNNNKFKISAPTWNDEFDLPDGSYSTSDIHDYFEFIIKKHETLTKNSPVQIYVTGLKQNCFQNINRIQIRIANSWNNEIIRRHKKDVDKDKDRENVPKLESAEVILVHCYLDKNDYQHSSKVLFTFISN